MLDKLIKLALDNRLVTVGLVALIFVYGHMTLTQLPIDVFPDLTRPTVTVQTEAHGLAPEEVETFITLPLENELNGLPELERVRSVSRTGLSLIYLEFAWDSELYLNRQLVAEKLEQVKSDLPEDVSPFMGPITSLMGQIQQISLSSKNGEINPIELRTLADWTLRPRLLSIPGIAQVISLGGGVKQYQILIDSEKLNHFQIELKQLDTALSKLNHNTSGGFLNKGRQELLIRNIGAAKSIEDIQQSLVGTHFGRPVLVGDIAEVKIGAQLKRGDASYNGSDAVVMAIQKQPGADTVQITQNIEEAIQDMRSQLPEDLRIETDIFKQATFINSSIEGVLGKLQSGSILVFIILLIFLANMRLSIITLTAIPLSFYITFITFDFFGLGVNTMTLGGLAIAIGELVDDSIVDVENIYRRLKENAAKANPMSALKVVFKASSEVRNSIVLATVIIALVFLPLFSLTGLEGRLLVPLGAAYLISLMASLLVSLTVTPVMSYYLLRNSTTNPKEQKETFVLKTLKSMQRKALTKLLHRPLLIIGLTTSLGLGAMALIPLMGRDFLPPFNEGTAMVTVFAPLGISLNESNRIGREVEKRLMSITGIKSVSRRTGRSEEDEHAMPVHISEIDVSFNLEKLPSKSKEEVLKKIRLELEGLKGVSFNVGQPLSHLMDHMLSGVSAQIALKIFGPELSDLRAYGAKAYSILKDIPGLVDFRLEQQDLIPQLKVYVLRDLAAQALMSPGEITEMLEGALNGKVVSSIIEEGRYFNLYYRFNERSQQDIPTLNGLVLKTLPNAQKVTLYDVADVYEGSGPNEINRENAQRRILLSGNVSGTDLGSVVEEVERRLDKDLDLKQGLHYTIGGQFESQERASRKILLYGLLAILAITFLLFIHFQSKMITAQILLSLPLAFMGGIVLLYLTEKNITIAALVGFVTLCGIASRNAIMMISHYLHIMRYEGEEFSKEMIIRGSQERLAPVLMTACTAIFALLPLLFAKQEAGSEILYPVAIVVVGGLLSSTVLDVIFTPVVFYNYAKKATHKYLNHQSKETL
jgi:Cu(I)/Ag(I) efflux system membrane protein CusA/SilA